MHCKLNWTIFFVAASVLGSPQFNPRPETLSSFGTLPDETVAEPVAESGAEPVAETGPDEAALVAAQDEDDSRFPWEEAPHTRTEQEIVTELSTGNSTKDTASLLRELQMVVAKSNPIPDSLSDDE